MIRIMDTQTAEKTILRRMPPDELNIPASVLENIKSIFGVVLTPEQAVRQIIYEVRSEGDEALRRWAQRLDGAIPGAFRVPMEEIEAAYAALTEKEREAFELAARRIENFYKKQPLSSWITGELGGTLGQLIRPINRVGLYVPAGSAPLPSSVLMSAVPAKVAGVPEIVVTAPPVRGTTRIDSRILAACAIAGVREVYVAGGAQAIAAMAYGTQSIRAVDKIFGPGNLFVTLAKRQVYGVVGIDGLAGPTETMVIADEDAQPAWVAADLLAQAEHDILASAILLTPSRRLAEAVKVEVDSQLKTLPRSEFASASLSGQGGIVITSCLDEAVDLANRYAAEHLCLAVKDPWSLVGRITNAGGLFLGERSFEVLGDYSAGPSHVMPTGGSARFASPLNIWDFVHIISLIGLDADTARELSQSAANFARVEKLEGHARAAEMRTELPA